MKSLARTILALACLGGFLSLSTHNAAAVAVLFADRTTFDAATGTSITDTYSTAAYGSGFQHFTMHK
jgi:hypothetical protein